VTRLVGHWHISIKFASASLSQMDDPSERPEMGPARCRGRGVRVTVGPFKLTSARAGGRGLSPPSQAQPADPGPWAGLALAGAQKAHQAGGPGRPGRGLPRQPERPAAARTGTAAPGLRVGALAGPGHVLRLPVGPGPGQRHGHPRASSPRA
jgi:hypothetical protein